MAGRSVALLVALLVLPLASAHGDDLARLYDPLTHPVAGWLTADGRIALAAAGEAVVAFPAGNPGEEGPPLTWSLTVPIGAALLGGIATHLVLRSDGPILAHPPDNALLRVATVLDGSAVNGTEKVVTASAAALQAGAYDFDVATGSARVATAPGGSLGLLVAFLGLAPNGAGVLVGPSGSRVSFTARAPDVAALGLPAPPGWTTMTADAFAPLEPTNEPILDLHIHHGDPDTGQQFAKVGTALTIRVINAETPEQGALHGPWGIDAPHVLRLTGLGWDETVRIGPSQVMLRPLRLTAPGVLTVSCAQECARSGPFMTLTATAAGGSADGPGTVQRVEPGKFAEANVQLGVNETITWAFRTEPSTVLHWDIHSHVGKDVTTYAAGNDAARNGTFTAPAAGIYSLLLENSNPDPVTVTYDVQGGTPYTPPPRNPLPFPGWLLLPALLGGALALRRRDA